VSHSSKINGGARLSRGQNRGVTAPPPETIAISFTPRLFLYTSRVNARVRRLGADRPEVWRRPLTGVRRSPEVERLAVEPARGSALSQDPGAQH
jgi:hypothetical protein